MKSILIVCEAGKGKGLGHFYRSLALAQILSNDFQVSILANNPDLPESEFKINQATDFESFSDYANFDLVILDGYEFSSNLIAILIENNLPFVEISDFSQPLYPTKHWINSSLNDPETTGKSLKYSLLRKELLEVAKTRTFEQKKLDSIFVAFGGTDELSNSLKIVEALHNIHYFSKIGVLYPSNGKDFDSLRKYAASDLDIEVTVFSNLSASELIQVTDQYAVALTSSSTIACEMVALRKVVHTCCLYQNQQLLHDQLTTSKAAFNLNLSMILDQPDLAESLVFELMNPEIEQETIFNFQKTLIDGFAEERICTFISNCFK